MQKIWKLRTPDKALQNILAHELNISPVTAGLLVNRNITTPDAARNFLKPSLSQMHDTNLLPDIDKAAWRIQKALKNKEKVLIFSDYDADGLTALAVLKAAFNMLGLKHEHYLPHRLKEGYGLNLNFVKYAHQAGINLVVTLDCGISNFKEIEELKRLGIDTVVVDHHQPQDGKLPCAVAVVDPKRQDSKYPYSELAGVGLSYKLACHLLNDVLEDQLDLVSIGTVADVVPLLDENRIIVKEGLKKLNSSPHIGIKAILDVAGVKKELTTEHIGYIIGPRLNACGRIDSSEQALSLLICSLESEAQELAKQLHAKNLQRQRIESEIIEEALQLAQNTDFSKNRVIVLHKDNWHKGVLGIVASKIADRFYRPTVVISWENELGKGSARSSANFHLFEGLLKCAEHLQGFGGHKHAAGLSILRNDIDGFRESINKVAFETLSAQDLIPALNVDLELKLADFDLDLVAQINMLAPFGQDNPKPLFASYGLEVRSKPLLQKKDTLKFWVSCGKFTYPAVGFRMGEYADLVSSSKAVDLVYRLSIDTWQGNNQLQLEIEDIKPS